MSKVNASEGATIGELNEELAEAVTSGRKIEPARVREVHDAIADMRKRFEKKKNPDNVRLEEGVANAIRGKIADIFIEE
jgi:hypothetical protein